jgi:hypothetical protein
MAADLPFLPGTTGELTVLGSASGLGYLLLIAVVALTAVFSSKPGRRKAALEVLQLLLPRRRRAPGDTTRRRLSRPSDGDEGDQQEPKS